MCLCTALVFCSAVPLVRAADDGRGPSMIVAAAQEAAEADSLVAACRYDEAEHWMKEAAKSAREARSNNPLERDVAGIAMAQMAVRLESFQRQRKTWDTAAKEVRRLLEDNHPEMARALLDQAAPPACDTRFTQLRAEITSRTSAAEAWISKGDEQAVRYPRTARSFYSQAQTIDPDHPGLKEKLLDVQRRIPDFCTTCSPQ